MISSTFTELIKPIVRMRFMLWAMLTGSVLFYVAVAWIVEMNRLDTELAQPGLRNIFYGVSVLLAAAAFWWRSVSLRGDTLRRRLLAGTGFGIVNRFLDTDRKRASYETLTDGEKRIVGMIADGLRGDIISLVLSEAVVVLGLVLVFLGARAATILPFAVITIVVNAFLIPRPMESLRRAGGREPTKK